MQNILIVSGPMRSGTTLMANLLHGGGVDFRHPQLSFASDTYTPLREITQIVAQEVSEKNALMNCQVSDKFIRKWQEKFKAFLPHFVEQIKRVAPVEFPEVIGMKTTCLLPELLALSGMQGLHVKFIIMHRDPRNIFASGLKRYSENPHGDSLAFLNASLVLDYSNCEIPNCMHIKYEDLIEDPQKIMRSVLEFIDLDWSRYDVGCFQGGVINNSSFAETCQDRIISKSSILPPPMVPNYEKLDKYYKCAFSELMGEMFSGNVEYVSWRIKRKVYMNLLFDVFARADEYGYALNGLKGQVSFKNNFYAQLCSKIFSIKVRIGV